jgi:hypothetical protein
MKKVNVVEILCTHCVKGKIRSDETIPEMGARDKENDGRGEFSYDIL